ncbi:hypothetical protein PV325_011596 [Microctonus aethiopoides]|nr:hypothetical protein PV325_011596 [Microctonus aethiopoides]
MATAMHFLRGEGNWLVATRYECSHHITGWATNLLVGKLTNEKSAPNEPIAKIAQYEMILKIWINTDGKLTNTVMAGVGRETEDDIFA